MAWVRFIMTASTIDRGATQRYERSPYLTSLHALFDSGWNAWSPGTVARTFK